VDRGDLVGRGKHATRSIALSVAAVGVAACAAGGADGSTSAAGDGTSTVTSATRTPRIVDDSGRPPVTFDPCLDIPDEILIEAGYDPRTEDSADFASDHYTFLGCSYRGIQTIPGVMRPYGLNILSGNVTFDEEYERYRDVANEIDINGRTALLELDPTVEDTCAVALETSYGTLRFSRLYNADHIRDVPVSAWCFGLQESVALIEPLVD
jgi:hypothetical protein